MTISCDLCAGTGWLSRDYELRGHPYSGLDPCRCTAGHGTGEIHRRVIAANNTEFSRLGIALGPTHRPNRLPPWRSVRDTANR